MAEIKHIYIGRAAPLLQGIEKLKRNEMSERSEKIDPAAIYGRHMWAFGWE